LRGEDLIGERFEIQGWSSFPGSPAGNGLRMAHGIQELAYRGNPGRQRIVCL